jgi:outer membrane protein TolC
MMPAIKLSAITVALFLSGCASVSINDNLSATQAFAKDRLQAEPRWLASDEARRQADSEVSTALDKPLTADDAVRIALRYSPNFQIMLAESAAASADATRSARLSNPVFSFEKMVRTDMGVRELEITRALAFSLFDVLTLPSRIQLANAQQLRLRMQAASDTVQAATDARQAWVRAVAAQQSVTYADQVMQAAEAGAELARRMQAAGNFSRLQRAREQAFYADATAQLARSRQVALACREALVRRLGLNEEQAARLRLPERLPDLPNQAREEQTTTQSAMDERLDVRLARFNLDATARAAGLTRIESVVNGLTVGVANKSESGKPMQRGYQLEVPLPIFDFGDATRASAQAQYMAAFYRTAQTAVDASSQVRQSYFDYRTAYDLAKHYRDEIVPLRKTISEEMQLQYNGMLIGVFDLLADAREQAGSVIAAIDAQRDFWLADAALQATLIGKPVTSSMRAATE